jgi:hypothetical protein
MGSGINLTAVVNNNAGNSLGGPITGTVTFFAGNQQLGIVSLNQNQAALTVQLTAARGFGIGNNTLTAKYSGDTNNFPVSMSNELTVYPPGVPLLQSLNFPSFVWLNSTGVAVTLNGANFNAQSQGLWNGSVRPTSYVSSTQLSMQLLAADTASAGQALVSVVNPAPQAATSVGLPFWVIDDTATVPVKSVTIASAPDASTGNYSALLVVPIPYVTNVVWGSAGTFLFSNGPEWITGEISPAARALRPVSISVSSQAGPSSTPFLLR